MNQITTTKMKLSIFEEINSLYNQKVNNLMETYKTFGARKCAGESGEVFEKFIDDVVKHFPHLQSLKNDYLTVECNGYKMTNVQVDRHIRSTIDNTLKSVIEGKTYLDSCYCKRAVIDFIEIAESSEITDNVDFVILTGQTSIRQNTFNYYQEFCKKHTGRYFKLFVVNDIKKRNSKKYLYKEKFKLDIQEVERFHDYIASL
jgi:hypothetical protein